MTNSTGARKFTVGNPRGIPAGIPVFTLADGRQFFEGDEVSEGQLSAQTVAAWSRSGILVTAQRASRSTRTEVTDG